MQKADAPPCPIAPAQPQLALARQHWIPTRDGNDTARGIFDRHYSRICYADGRFRRIFVGPGEKMVLITAQADALFVWRKFISMDRQQGVNCAVFRNESDHQSSALIGEAMRLAWERWPGERLYTYVNATRIRSTNPGYCFQMAGWGKAGRSGGGLHILSIGPPRKTETER